MKTFTDRYGLTREQLRAAIDERRRIQLETRLDQNDAELRRLGEEFRRDRAERETRSSAPPSRSKEEAPPPARAVPPPAPAERRLCRAWGCWNVATATVTVVVHGSAVRRDYCRAHADECRLDEQEVA